MRTVRTALVALLAALAALIATAGTAGAQEAGRATLRMGWAQDPGTLNPFVGLDEEDYSIWALNWDLLVNFDPKTLKPAPGIAKTWDVSPDGRTVTYHLDPEAKWSDGRPVTSADVKWSLDTLGGNGALFTGYTSNVKSLDTPDAKTVVLHGKKPDARFVGGLFVYILPKHVWGKVPLKKLTGSFKPKLPLVGSGPYVTTEYRRGSIIRMRRNPGFRGEAGAYSDIQWIKYGNQDATERALTLGEIDLVREVSAGGYARLGKQPNVDVSRAPSPSYTQMTFNSCTKARCPKGTWNPAVSDTTVRQAIAYGIDRGKLQQIATRGTSFVANGILPSYYKTFYEKPSQSYPFDPAKARQMLDAAGWRPGDGGVRRKGSQELRFNLNVRSESPFTVQMAKLIAEMGKAIGVRFDVQVVSTDKLTELTTRRVKGKPAPEYDTFIWGWGGDPYDPSFLLHLLTTDAIATETSDAFYSNPEYDRLDAEQSTIFDVPKRKQVISQMIDLTQRDLPYLVLSEDPKLEAYRTDRISKIAPICPARTGGLFCDATSYEGVLALRPVSLAAGSAKSPTGSTGLGLVVGLGLGFLAGLAVMRRRRGSAEPLELPG
jgi:peptide/nickel transport system substrate-binding protein